MKVGAITDEFSPDIEIAAEAMHAAGLEAAELRIVGDANVLDLSDDELDRALRVLRKHNLQVNSVASPLLKCTLPDGPPVDNRFQQDAFASDHTFAEQGALAQRAFAVAKMAGARIVRVFSYWRTVDPDAVFERIVTDLRRLAEQAAEENLVIGLENEHACNIATARETARVLAAIAHPHFQVVWDPANAIVAGEKAFPDGFRLLSVERIAHVHAKDRSQEQWVAIGDGEVDWPAQVTALGLQGYRGDINLETHWQGPHGNKLEASQICAARLRQMVASL